MIQKRWGSLLEDKDLEELYNLESTELVLDKNGETTGFRVYKPFKGIIAYNAKTKEYVSNVNNLSFSAVQAISKDFINNEDGISTTNGEAIIQRAIAERKRSGTITELKAQGGSDTIDSVFVNNDGTVSDTDLDIQSGDVNESGKESNTGTGTGTGTGTDREANVDEVINDIVWITPTMENAEKLLEQKNQKIQDDYIASGGQLGKDGGRLPQWWREITSEGGFLDQKRLNKKIQSLIFGFRPLGKPYNPEENIAELKSLMATEEGGLGNYVSALPEVQSAIEYINSVPKYASLYNVEEDDVNDIASGGVNPNISTINPMYLGGIMTPRLNNGGTIDETVVTGTRGAGVTGRGLNIRGGGLGRPTDSLSNTFADSLIAAEKLDKEYGNTKNKEIDETVVKGQREAYPDIGDYRSELIKSSVNNPFLNIENNIDTNVDLDTNKTSDKELTVKEVFGNGSKENSLNSLNIAAIENFKKDLPASIEAASVKGTVADNPRDIGESIFQSLAKSLVEGDDWIFGGMDTKGFQKYKDKMGVNSNYVFNTPAGLGKN